MSKNQFWDFILLTWILTGSVFIKFCGFGSGYNHSGSISLLQCILFTTYFLSYLLRYLVLIFALKYNHMCVSLQIGSTLCLSCILLLFLIFVLFIALKCFVIIVLLGHITIMFNVSFILISPFYDPIWSLVSIFTTRMYLAMSSIFNPNNMYFYSTGERRKYEQYDAGHESLLVDGQYARQGSGYILFTSCTSYVLFICPSSHSNTLFL